MEDSQFLGRGWKFPTVFSGMTHLAEVDDSEDEINRSIDEVLQIRRDKGSLLPYAGCELSRFAGGHMAGIIRNEMALSVRRILSEYELRIQVNEVAVDFPTEENHVDICIWYTKKQTNTRHQHVFSFPFQDEV